MKIRLYFKRGLAFAGIACGLLAMATPLLVSALTGTFSDYTNNPDSVSLRPIVSEAGGSVTLTADESDFAVFIPNSRTSDVTVTITDACDFSTWNDIGDTSLRVGVFEVDADGDPLASPFRAWKYNQNGSWGGSDCSSAGDIVFSNIALSNFSSPQEGGYLDYPGYKMILVKVLKTNQATGGLKAFKVNADGTAYVTYDKLKNAQDSLVSQPVHDFSIWNATSNTSTNPQSVIQFKFAPACSVARQGNGSVDQTVFLKWYDADQGVSGEQDDTIKFKLWDLSTGSTVIPNSAQNSTNNLTGKLVVVVDKDSSTFGPSGGSQTGMGGNAEYRAYKLPPGTLMVNHKYLWQWLNVNRKNGLQLWMPFSDINTRITCPEWNLSGTTTLSDKLIGPGDTTTFTHTVTNNGDTAKYTWIVQGQYYSDGVNGNGWNNTHYGLNALGSGDLPCSNRDSSGNCNDISTNDGASRPNGVAYNYQFPAGAVLGAKYCQRIYFTNATGPNSPADTSTSKCVTNNGSHCSVDTLPKLLEPGLTNGASFTIHFTLNPAPPVDGKATFTIGGMGGGPYAINTKAGQKAYDSTFNFSTVLPGVPSPAPGDHIVTWSVNTPAIASNSDTQCTLSVYTLPYYKVFGSSISAGGGFDGTSAGGHLGGWYNNGLPLSTDGSAAGAKYGGAGAQFGATALGQIIGVGGNFSNIPVDLTLANNDPTTIESTANDTYSPQLGGFFGGAHTFYNPSLAHTTPIGSTYTIPATTTTGSYYTTNSDLTITSGPVADSSHISLDVDGNAYIKSPGISYQGSGGWTSTGQIPSFVLRADGNIYIDPNVTTLDGLYIATGTIYTCATGLGSPVSTDGATNLWNNCHNQLVVHGAFIAKQINLMRTFGSLKDSYSNDNNPQGGAKGCTNSVSVPVCAGEVFDFSPELYLSNWGFQSNGSNGNLNGISALPPVL